MPRFLRTAWTQKSKLGKRRRKRQKWRRARGRHNKIREKRKGRLRKVEIGYGKNKKFRGKINGKIPIFIKNFKDLEKVKKNDAVIIARIGRRKRLKIAGKINDIGAKILNERK